MQEAEVLEQITSSKLRTRKLGDLMVADSLKSKAKQDQMLMIARMVVSEVALIPKAKDGVDGKSIKGEDGKPGKSIKGNPGYTPQKNIDYFDGKQGNPGKTPRKGIDYKDGYTPVKGIDYFDGKDGESVKGDPGYSPVKDKDYFDGKDGKDGHTPVKGIDYFDGKTPIKGVDYFDGKDGKSIKGQEGYTPVKGKDYHDGVTPVKGINYFDGLTPRKDIDYFDGEPGKPGKDAVGKQGIRGKRGADGVGIKDISESDGKIIIELTDSTVTKFKLPKSTNTISSPGYVGPDGADFQRADRVPYSDRNTTLGVDTVQKAIEAVNSKIVQAASGNPFAVDTAAAFMYDFKMYEDTHSADFVYNASKQLISKSVVEPDTNVLYLVDFTYVTGVLVSKLVTKLSDSTNVETVFEYDANDLLTRKILTLNI